MYPAELLLKWNEAVYRQLQVHWQPLNRNSSKSALNSFSWRHSGRVARMVKNRPAMRETWVRLLGWEDPLEKDMATHFSILAWRIPWTRGAWRLLSMGSQRARHGWSDLAEHTTCVCVCVCVCVSWFQLVLPPVQHFTWCTPYKLNKQGDSIQPWPAPFPIWNQSVVPCPVLFNVYLFILIGG